MTGMKPPIPVRLLVIDDDAAVCRQIGGWLQADGYDVVTFTDAGEGRQHAARSPCQVALVDLRLPDRDGAEVIAELQSACPEMRIIALSAFPEANQVIAAMRAGAHDLLEKPIQQPTLHEALQRQLAALGIGARDETEFNRRLGARLREIRRAKDRTVGDIAADSGISAGALSQIELGKTATSTWTLARICAALRVPMATLFDKP